MKLTSKTSNGIITQNIYPIIKFNKELNNIISILNIKTFEKVLTSAEVDYVSSNNGYSTTTNYLDLSKNNYDELILREVSKVYKNKPKDYLLKYNTFWKVQPIGKLFAINHDDVEFLKRIFNPKLMALL